MTFVSRYSFKMVSDNVTWKGWLSVIFHFVSQLQLELSLLCFLLLLSQSLS